VIKSTNKTIQKKTKTKTKTKTTKKKKKILMLQLELNYQRLEFLGDSALKFLLSKHLFLTNPTMHEGLLSQMRAHLCCNRFLFEKAIEKSLFKYPTTFFLLKK